MGRRSSLPSCCAEHHAHGSRTINRGSRVGVDTCAWLARLTQPNGNLRGQFGTWTPLRYDPNVPLQARQKWTCAASVEPDLFSSVKMVLSQMLHTFCVSCQTPHSLCLSLTLSHQFKALWDAHTRQCQIGFYCAFVWV